jgi:hypothetical protein
MVLALAILSPLGLLLALRATLFLGIMLIDAVTPRCRIFLAAADVVGGRDDEATRI